MTSPRNDRGGTKSTRGASWPYSLSVALCIRTKPPQTCYDESAKTMGPLNECFYTGSSFGQLIIDILVYFCYHRVLVDGDIEKAFLMASMNEGDCGSYGSVTSPQKWQYIVSPELPLECPVVQHNNATSHGILQGTRSRVCREVHLCWWRQPWGIVSDYEYPKLTWRKQASHVTISSLIPMRFDRERKPNTTGGIY